MKNRSGNREPVDIPRERHEGWGDDNATPTPQEEAHRHQLVEEMTASTAPNAKGTRYAIRNPGTESSEVVDNDEEAGNGP